MDHVDLEASQYDIVVSGDDASWCDEHKRYEDSEAHELACLDDYEAKQFIADHVVVIKVEMP